MHHHLLLRPQGRRWARHGRRSCRRGARRARLFAWRGGRVARVDRAHEPGLRRRRLGGHLDERLSGLACLLLTCIPSEPLLRCGGEEALRGVRARCAGIVELHKRRARRRGCLGAGGRQRLRRRHARCRGQGSRVGGRVMRRRGRGRRDPKLAGVRRWRVRWCLRHVMLDVVIDPLVRGLRHGAGHAAWTGGRVLGMRARCLRWLLSAAKRRGVRARVVDRHDAPPRCIRRAALLVRHAVRVVVVARHGRTPRRLRGRYDGARDGGQRLALLDVVLHDRRLRLVLHVAMHTCADGGREERQRRWQRR